MALISLQNVSRFYHSAGEEVRALDGVNLEIEEGEVVMLLGPSGSGKTTLLNIISALDSPTSGDYKFGGNDVPSASHSRKLLQAWKRSKELEKMAKFRRENIGYIFQFFNLLGDLTVLENVLLSQEIHGGRNRDRALEVLEMVGLEGLENRFPSELSGGQQQRVAIARSIAKSPRILLGDEPTGNLDSKTTEQVMRVLVDACRKEKITAIIVTHDSSLTKFATRVIELDSGKLVSDESKAQTILDTTLDTAKMVGGAIKNVVVNALEKSRVSEE
ncbi:MAG: ABC transporter ATP-binding protein [Candidatus Thalassarchaeaceae archaeon]|jgi:putative ABC transport system ATP-binding protein|nr:ABC transporter ATP-binding protein [Candidatus Thalassarchaeaceae archaeon]